MRRALDFQSIIMALQRFWADYGCLIWQPYYLQVGAGTYNPATFLRVLGPEPWKVAYVEPSIRPDDGRYGENPNRMQMHYQFQVILKPDPGNPQEVYLQSLAALGIDAREHDIRFVEDNWESPALGAWGLGWEVWLDGQEITQFTYFQQAGGQMLDPVSVEITYGLERIAMALQRVSDFRHIRWNEYFTDGDVNLQGEQEHSKYYFEIADVSRLEEMFALFEREAQACLQAGLVLPAHDYVLKCSHTFNVLDTRGAVGVTQRQALFARMRELSRRVAQAYLDQRQRLEFPWLEKLDGAVPPQVARTPQLSNESRVSLSLPNAPQPFLLEIGTEELPAADLSHALRFLSENLPGWLEKLRLEHGEIRVMGTPRRLVVYIPSLAARQRDVEEVIKGPPAERAFDAQGQPTPAAQGFARSKGVAVSDLEVAQFGEARYVVARVRQPGRAAIEVLAEAIPEWLAALRFERGMRWNHTNVIFSRPIRWILALMGEGESSHVVPFSYAGLAADRCTRGLRWLEPHQRGVASPKEYFDFLSAQGIVLQPEERKAHLMAQVQKLAAQVKGEALVDADLLEEVTHLVEAPHALLGSYAVEHLQLPREVLISVMKKHQRYFPIVHRQRVAPSSENGASSESPALLPYFITIRNGDSYGEEVVRQGNEHVLRARFADAAYFVREDRKKPLEAFLPRLATMTFQVELGSMLDKTKRLEALVSQIGELLGLDEIQQGIARRAARLCKADLATQMVVEMTSLQGVMGRDYALHSGEPPEVAEAIFEHYLPRYSGDQLPRTLPGLALGLADRLDSLTGLFAAGLIPTGNKDPFALRRAALGLVQNLIGWDLSLDLRHAIHLAAAHLPLPLSPERANQLSEFILERMRFMFLEEGERYDVVDAVLAVQGNDPAAARRAVRELGAWVQRADWRSILPAFARCVRITRPIETHFEVQPQVFVEEEERQLWQALLQAEARPRRRGCVSDFLEAFLPMIDTINRFFDRVLVMCEDERLQHNRLALLQRIVALADGVADFSRLEGF